jgi:hypothetical protein
MWRPFLIRARQAGGLNIAPVIFTTANRSIFVHIF